MRRSKVRPLIWESVIARFRCERNTYQESAEQLDFAERFKIADSAEFSRC